MSNKKRKKFYNTKNRGQKWTEEPQGRPISFADKYGEGTTPNAYGDDKKPAFQLTPQQAKAKRIKTIRRILAVVLAFVLVGTGYTCMDAYMTRHARPAEELLKDEVVKSSFAQMDINIASIEVESVSFDNSTMLSAVISEVQGFGCSSVTFDAKREDGTIGYQSSLANIDTFNAASNNGSNTKGSINKLTENDILPVARICCYLDNVAPQKSTDIAITKSGKLYKDKDGNTYLNPSNPQAYEYISDIIKELYSFGVKVFVLYGYDLPSDIAEEYGDGFDALAGKLSADLNNDIKLLKQVDVTIKGIDQESGKVKNSAIEKEIKSLKKLDKNQIYYISTNVDYARVVEKIGQNNIDRFVLGK